MSAFSDHKMISAVPRGTILAPRAYAPTLIDRVISLFPTVMFALFFMTLLAVLGLSGFEQMRYSRFQNSLTSVNVRVLAQNPKMSQAAVDTAMAAYSVVLPSYAEWPKYDPDLIDRGLTTGGTLDFKRSVTVGPSAFTSWGVLGSTLGHEIEIHCGQSFGAVLALDFASSLQNRVASLFHSLEVEMALRRQNNGDYSWGTWRAERIAYSYELDSADRFGLHADEVRSIKSVMEQYYPAAQGGVAAKSLSSAE